MATLNTKLNKITKNINQKPNQVLEELIEFIERNRNLDRGALRTVFDHVAEAIAKCFGKIETSNYYEVIFDRRIPLSRKEFTASVFLRIMVVNNATFNNCTDIKFKSFVLFDEVFLDIYKKLGIQIRDQSYIKEDKLTDFVNSLDKAIDDCIRSISDINSLTSFEKEYKRILYNKLNFSYIKHFIPQEYTRSKIEEFFSLLNTNVNNNLQDRTQFKNLNSILKEIIKWSYDFDTKYSRTLISVPFSTIHKLITDITGGTKLKSAQLKIRLSDKKYPLHNINTNFKIRLILENRENSEAYNVAIQMENYETSLEIYQKKIEYREIRNTSTFFDIDCSVKEVMKSITILGYIEWENYDGQKEKDHFNLKIEGQENDINWDELRFEDPYSTEPVESEEKLIGRNEILDRMFAKMKSPYIGSFFIHGQKRVGKTSIAKTLKSKITTNIVDDFLVIYMETGEYQATTTDIEQTINNLCLRICKKIIAINHDFKEIVIPDFNGSFSSIHDFFDQVEIEAPSTKILIILDEFDEINPKLYHRGEIGDSFFLTIRAISNKKNFGFVLVGGEKMNIILSCQAEKINKFQNVRVDYFDKEHYFEDFKELVRNPVPDLVITDKSLDLLHNYTAGNPYFTKQICEVMYNQAVDRRDNYVTESEMSEAIEKSMADADTNSFAHFWDDGIETTAEKEEIISMNRRKVLLAIAELLKKYSVSKKDSIIELAANKNISEDNAKRILREFIDRKILYEDENKYFFVLKYFEEWLRNFGFEKIITTFSDAEKIKELQRKEDQAKVTAKEINSVIEKWEPYQGREVSADHIREWLDQFGEHTHQRLMFSLLENLRFYTQYNIRVKMKELFKRIISSMKATGYKLEIVDTKEKSSRELALIKRRDLLVSYLDNVGKSGAEYAKLFADENEIFQQNVIEKSKIQNIISHNSEIKAIVFIDDFIGTGKSITKNLKILFEGNEGLMVKKGVSYHIGVVAGFQRGKYNIEEYISKHRYPVTIYISDILTEKDMVFNSESTVYSGINERNTAKDICYSKGANLVDYNELGFGDCQALVTFYNTCPNNTLPVLWKKTSNWNPLFERK